ncbi:MAG: cyclic nucleotide-binding domain-containing protein [Acidimicrobiales bacterium]|nr:cyclic nucleotide-binding domain-containing protein [Acidimicrobiales bacterium]
MKNTTNAQFRALEAFVPAREIHELDHLGTVGALEAAHELVHIGDVGRECLVILDGTVLVDREDGTTPIEVGPGEIIGELALITGAERNATVTAQTEVTALALHRAEFNAALADCPHFAKHALLRAVERLAPTG